MREPSGPWSPERTIDFLREATIPIRLACRTPGNGLWMVSLWYRYREGGIECATSADADVVELLRADPGIAFEVSTNEPPYKGVRGRGTVSIEPDEERVLLRTLLERYLGGTDSTLARRLLSPDREEVRLRIEPERIATWDFTERMADAVEGDGAE